MMTGHGMGFSGIFWMLTIWVIVIGVGIWLLAMLFPKGNSSRPTGHGESGDDALEILKRRYARGELSQAEFEEIRRDLEL